MKRFLAAVGLLTILPVGSLGAPSREDTARSAAAFPAVGLLQGLLLAGVYMLCVNFLPPGVTAALVLTALVISSGGFHIDGLSDTADAIAKRGTIKEKLAVMKDGSSGAVGTAAVVLALLLKFSLLSALASSRGVGVFLLIILMPVYSKWAMSAALFHGKPAKGEGLGSMLINGTGAKEFFISTALLFAIAAGTAAVFFRAPSFFYIFSLLTAAVLYLFVRISVFFINRSFGGLTGDSFGAINELSEVIYLLTAVVWLRQYF